MTQNPRHNSDGTPMCPVKGCANTRNPQHVMCSTCWSYVKPSTQREVYRAWSRRKNGALSMSDYLATRLAAIEEVMANRPEHS